ncbi:GNAT family N-acetyltransferase [Haladaptatus sp. DFWS20]|uniref:GNAT family N-acetyltransferase n=1 Tax=Haladaptatus sp. DFWS20 TaxID=3403467 RepID=UPI003EBEB389
MKDMEIRELKTESERLDAVPILRQLWSDIPPEDVLEWTADDEYHLFGGFADEELVGVAGVLVKHVLHHARNAWLYDLVVDEPRRSEGYGASLIEFVERWAEERDCEHVALASPVTKDGVHRYYEGQNYEKWGYVLEKEL